MPPGSKVHSYAAVGVVEFFTRPNDAMLGRRWVSPALDPTYDLDAAYFLTTRPHIPHAGPFHREEQAKMRAWIAPIAALLVTTTVAAAQSPIPSLKGAWKGTGKILLFGTTEYLSGSPREAVVRDLEVTHTVLGQDGRLIWGTTSAGNNDVKEPFAWAVTADNKTIIGADTDGYYRITILSPDQMEKCYVQNAASSRQAIVASCFVMSRVNQ
jgi:hypothetical protein